MAVNHLIQEAVQCPLESPRFAFIAPYLKESKDIAWDYLKKYAGVIPENDPHEGELRMNLPGDRRIRLYGADNPESIQGIYLDGVVMDEYQFTHPRVFKQIVRPMLADRKGWVLFLGKPLGHNHFYELYETLKGEARFLTRLYRASETNVLDAEELALMRQDMGEDLYAQEVECSWEAAIQGAYYARQLDQCRADKRIRSVPWEPTGPSVETYWDLGFEDATAILFVQRMGRELHVIDYHEARKYDLRVYAKVIREKPYLYAKHNLPPDAGQHQLASGGVSLAEQLQALGVRPVAVHAANEPLAGINQARLLFPRLWFDETRCGLLLEALASYRAEYDEKKKDFKDHPLHDWASHGADALRLLACNVKFGEDVQRPRDWKPKPSRVDFNPFTVLDAPKGHR